MGKKTKEKKDKFNYIMLFVCIVISLSAGFIGGAFTQTGEGSWYSSINKPSFNPPNWVFGPVWTLLYILIGISLYLALKKGLDRQGQILFGAQLLLNTLWSIIFFGMKNPLLAFVDIILLWLSIIATMVYFYRYSKTASYLLLPYLLWVSFASVLNIAIYIIN